MFIKKLKVKNFLSIKELELNFYSPLTVFIGPNNSGKSNILSIIDFLKHLMKIGIPHINSLGGFQNIVHNGNTRETIYIELSGEIDNDEFSYSIEMSGGPNFFTVIDENFKSNRQIILEQDKKTGEKSVRLKDKEKGRMAYQDMSIPILSSLVGRSDIPKILVDFASAISNYTVYRLEPSRITEPNPSKAEKTLSQFGENLSSLLHTLKANYDELFSEVENWAKQGILEIDKLNPFLTESMQTFPVIKEKNLSLDIPLWLMSDGIKKFLSLLTLIYSPEIPLIFAIEEPENFIHTHLLEMIADLLKFASEKSHILVATHSPYILNHLEPENVVIVEKKEGTTLVTHLNEKEEIKSKLKELRIPIGDLWYSGLIGGVPE